MIPTIYGSNPRIVEYVGKTENRRGSTNANWVCEKELSVESMQSMISVPYLTLDRRNVRTSFLYNYEPSCDCTYEQK